MGKSFTTAIANRADDPVVFDIDGEEFHFVPPKTAALMMALMDSDDSHLGQLGAMLDWLKGGLPEAENDRINERLRDPADGLDIDTMGDLVRYLIGESTGRPST